MKALTKRLLPAAAATADDADSRILARLDGRRGLRLAQRVVE